MGGAWVFPGGAVDAHEGEGDEAHRVGRGARARRGGGHRAASTPPRSCTFSRWITPAEVKIRFDTHFFLAAAARRAREPRIDGAEIVDHGWFTPAGRARRPSRRRASCSSSRRSSTSSSSRRSRRADALLAHARGARGRPRAAAVVAQRRDRARVLLPGDEGYDAAMSLTVAVTGPTGEIGKPFIRALERQQDVSADPRDGAPAVRPRGARAGARPSTARATCSTARRSTRSCAEADVVVHLAFIIVAGSQGEPQHQPRGIAQRLRGGASRAKVQRLVYASSVAAYGFHEDNPLPLTEDVPARGTEAHPY